MLHKFCLLGMLFIILLFPGCDVLTAPFELFKELLPLAIKYAPYALMFLEEQDPNNPIYADSNQFQQHILTLAESPTPTLQLDSIPNGLCNELPQRKNKLRYVVAIHLSDLDKVERIQSWLASQNSQFRISYLITAYDQSNLQESQTIAELISQNSLTFFADGPLSNLSTAQIENCKPFFENR